MDVGERLSGNQLLAPPRVICPDALSQPASERLCYAMTRDRAEVVPVVKKQASEFGPAEDMRLLQYCIEYRSQVAGRGIDDLQDFGSRSLLLQGLAGLGQQSRVFHRDDRLCREVLEQCNFLLGEQSRLASGYGNCAK